MNYNCYDYNYLSYNFYDYNDTNKWERYSLLNLLYNNSKKIKLAPSRLTLNIFGGPFNINQFREFSYFGYL